MKLLDWMHRKLMQNSIEPMKNTTIGKASTCFSVQFIEPTKALSHSNIKCQKSSKKSEANEEVLLQEEPLEPFDFLAIGTFGLEILNTDPPTPTLPTPFEELTNQKTEITENDLKLINYELEKFLETEEKEILNDTSERSSHVSITTLVNKPIEGTDSEEQMYMVACPLQNYLLSSSIELAETDEEVKRENASLAESNIVRDTITKFKGVEQQTKKMSMGQFMKKVVKKINPSSSSKKVEATASSPIKKKLSKALTMFHRKVHPEEMPKNQSGRKKNSSSEDSYPIRGANESNNYGQATSEKGTRNSIKMSTYGICEGLSTVSGHWIKTDSEYLVLEL